jgi:signal transduction histidine kinase
VGEPELESVQRELAYYKRHVDEVAGQNLKLDYAISGLRHEIRQKQQGFALLSQLQQSIGAQKRISAIFELAIAAINSVLGMDRTVVLTPTDRPHTYRPSQWVGFLEQQAQPFRSLEFEFPPEFASGEGLLIATRATEATSLIERVRDAFGLPYFIGVPVIVEGAPIGLLLSGRLKEARPLYPPLDEGDVDTFHAIAGLISASVQNMRISVLEEMDRLKTEFFANISHEFRTPITLTLGPLEQLLSGRRGELPGWVRERLEVMQRNQQRLLELINQILDLAKLEAGRMELRCAPMRDVNRFVEQRAEQFRPVAEPRGVELRLELDDRLGGADLYVDAAELDRLVVNLLSNAVKFTHEGWIEVKTERTQEALRLAVADSGVGITADELPHIFDRFRQAGGGATREYAGTGIGLALVKEIATLHGGEVTVHSQQGRGSTFRVTLPLGKDHLNPASVVEVAAGEADTGVSSSAAFLLLEGAGAGGSAEEANAAARATFDPRKRTILYAEDNADLRDYVRDLLAPDYNVFLAVDGREALELLRAQPPDLVVTDLMIPLVSGRELVQTIRADRALESIPVLVLTARSAIGARIESLDAGADDFASKPFDAAELRARIRSLLRIKEYQDTIRAQAQELAGWNQTLGDRVREQLQQIEALRAEVESQLREVRASRSRIVQAADDARRRLERDLHDGAQQRLTTVGLILRSAQAKPGAQTDPELARVLAQGIEELQAGLGELRALARGLHPAILSEEGLVPAVRALTSRSPVPVKLFAPALDRLPGPVETAAYFVVSEALTNVVKHANASRAQVTVERQDGVLIVEVADDGSGGAAIDAGSGLSGLFDRVAAIDGRLALDSPADGGTRVRCELPCG